ncbi:hypothetical protein LIER_10784 [Lithospermum erythrorhizon]|uniref:Uncharacterized protein n=1 Tax=Lithospermum erythrorhizon TaxID=34254 RepID=A0AAV3PKM9_LITER
MVNTRGNAGFGSNRGKARTDHVVQRQGKKYSKSKSARETPSGEPIPLQIILPQIGTPEVPQVNEGTILYLPWRDDVVQGEPNPGHGDQIQPEQSVVGAGGSRHVPPIMPDTGKPRNPSSYLLKMVGSMNTLVRPAGYSDRKWQMMPIILKMRILVVREGVVGGSRKKRRLRNQGVLVRHDVEKDPPVVNLGDEGVVVDSPRVNQDDDDVVVIFHTTSKTMKRTNTSVAFLEKKRVALVAGEMRLRLLRRQKRVSTTPKKNKWVIIFEPKRTVGDDKFIPDDEENESEDEEVAKILKERSRGKLKKNDNMNRVNNRWIAKDVPNLPTDGVEFNSEKKEARWKFICARNILPERTNKEITGATMKLGDIIKDLTGNTLTAWPIKCFDREVLEDFDEDVHNASYYFG